VLPHLPEGDLKLVNGIRCSGKIAAQSASRQYQAVTAVWVQAAVVVVAALAAKSSASLACHARAASVIARRAAILSSTARRR
jgi:hypothetical protein